MRDNAGAVRNEVKAPKYRLPSVDQVLRCETGQIAVARYGHKTAVEAIRHILVGLRGGPSARPYGDASAIAAAALHLAEEADAPSVRRVFNLTGTVLHTNLGRAILPEVAINAAVDAMRNATALEFDLDSGGRGERDDHIRGLLRELTGAEDACAVNNNAGAVLITLNTFAQGKNAIVSRGELIEIGGSFRLPDIMKRAGTKLVEVGTTNCTHFRDYEQAIDENTGLILKAHTSNYLIQGFTKAVPSAELSSLARSRSIAFIHDLGSGALADLSQYGLKSEPTVAQAISEGCDIVTFSGDKLLGGPQAGIIAGRKDLIERIAKNPMKRALRLDKIRLAALEAVLKLYRDPERLPETLPTLRYFVRQQAEIASFAGWLCGPLSAALGENYSVRVIECSSQIGSGSLPLETLASAGIAIAPNDRKASGRQLDILTSAFRRLPVPVIGRIKDGALLFDLRCLEDGSEFLGQLQKLNIEANPGAHDANSI
ncbi:MAG: L-seryl-tRNA(Sec) selenium transferase [Rhodomicrobium sp.]